MPRKTVSETTANLCRTLTCISFWKAKGEKKNLLFKLWGSWGKTITDSMFICDGATRHKERATMPRDFPRLLRRVQPIFPNPCQDVWLCCILFSLLLYEEWSNQARKRVSSVCRRVKRDFQNNPLSRWGFFLFFCITFCCIVSVFQDSRGNDNYCPDAVFLNGRTFFFFPFSGSHAQLLCCMSTHVMEPCYYSVSWRVIFCQMKCWIASYSE